MYFTVKTHLSGYRAAKRVILFMRRRLINYQNRVIRRETYYPVPISCYTSRKIDIKHENCLKHREYNIIMYLKHIFNEKSVTLLEHLLCNSKHDIKHQRCVLQNKKHFLRCEACYLIQKINTKTTYAIVDIQ